MICITEPGDQILIVIEDVVVVEGRESEHDGKGEPAGEEGEDDGADHEGGPQHEVSQQCHYLHSPPLSGLLQLELPPCRPRHLAGLTVSRLCSGGPSQLESVKTEHVTKHTVKFTLVFSLLSFFLLMDLILTAMAR